VLVQIDSWTESENLLKIAASIVVEKSGQKAIVIGTKASRLKQIGTEARLELEEALGMKIYLELFVKVRQGWRGKPGYLADLDWKG
jgi:GTP-binding protein Era